MRRPETKVRVRALQLLYAWEVQAYPPIERVIHGLLRRDTRWTRQLEAAEPLATAVAREVDRLDREIQECAEHWRLDRLGVIERNILRIALYELSTERVPPKVAINEAVELAHWFAGPKAPAFINGVIDALARRSGRL